MSKTKRVIELLGIKKHIGTAEKIIENMQSNLNNLEVYCASEALLFNILGIDTLKEASAISEETIIELHDKIKFIMGMSVEMLTESNKLYSFYFESKQISRDINKINKKNFRWNKWDSLNETDVPDPAVTGDKGIKKDVAYYDSKTNKYLGQEVDAQLIMKFAAQGIVLMSDHYKKADRNVHKRDGSEMK